MFSVIMPVYNHAAYVGQAVESVLAQSRPDWELIVVDDGSADGSDAIVEGYTQRDGRGKLIRQPNAGPAAARNRALGVAAGQWLTYIDSDDLWLSDALAKYAAFIDSHPEATFIYGYRHRLSADGSVTETTGEHQDRVTGTRELFQRMYLSHLCVCYRRELIDKAGPYDASLRSCEDYELYLRMSLHTKFWPLGEPTGLRRRHGSNLSTQTGFSRYQEAEILRRFVNSQGGGQVLDADAVARRLSRLYYSSGRQYFKSRCFAKARCALGESLRWRGRTKTRMLMLACKVLAPLGRDDGKALPSLV